jgi:uncharacterized protein YbjT (DUF2867 family)
MAPSILITGGTGTLGKLVTARLAAAGYDLRLLSRGRHEPPTGIEHVTVDLLAGRGVASAMVGIDTIVHLAGGPKNDGLVTRNLMQAAQRAGVRHIVAISAIGADRMPLGYFRAKREAEQAIAGSGIPSTTVRAAQFHELCLALVQKISALPVIPAPSGMRFQPIAADEVADRLVELASAQPAGLVADLPGPEVQELGDLVRIFLKIRGKHRWLLPVRMPGKAGRAYRAGDNLSRQRVVTGTRTWEQFLHETCAVTGPAAQVSTRGSMRSE